MKTSCTRAKQLWGEEKVLLMTMYSKEEKQAILEKFKASGNSFRKFADEMNMPILTMKSWLKKEQDLTFGAIEIQGSRPPLMKTMKLATVFDTERVRVERWIL